MEVIRFTKVALPYGWLGNMSPFPLEFGGKQWRTSEALFQALRFKDQAIQELIREEKSPMGAKFIMKAHKEHMTIEPHSKKGCDEYENVFEIKVATTSQSS